MSIRGRVGLERSERTRSPGQSCKFCSPPWGSKASVLQVRVRTPGSPCLLVRSRSRVGFLRGLSRPVLDPGKSGFRASKARRHALSFAFEDEGRPTENLHPELVCRVSWSQGRKGTLTGELAWNEHDAKCGAWDHRHQRS